MNKFRTGDRVIVISGRDKGKRGVISSVNPVKSRAVVSGVNQVKRHVKPSQQGPGGIETGELPIHLSNLAHEDPKDGKPTRVGFEIQKDGTKVRKAKRSGEIING